ncbi:hypothetical protein [Pedobacter insulae]|uniref:Uncharacterized protein n=1 Tax=Pedobacter insulae TaxID=414048 RepID=A0A1I2ZC89_9SPHI|nr:hypothetical protein [Pedobacter insulae]SFH35225.1 hypothetical protein SAMN04489864_109138 [Pedobacter insulae]
MKTLIYILLAITLCSSCFAQNSLKDGKHNYDGKTFAVTKNSYMGKTSFSVRVAGQFDNKPQHDLKDPNGLPMSRKDIHVDTNKVKEIIRNILEPHTKELSANKDQITLQFKFAQKDGSIESIYYFLNGNTIINLKEIAKMDRQIKKQVKATFTGTEHNNYFFINYGYVRVIF